MKTKYGLLRPASVWLLCLSIACQMAHAGGLTLSKTKLSPTSAEEAPTSSTDTIAQLAALNIPLFIVTTSDGEDPTFDTIAPPPGIVPIGITNNNYCEGRLLMIMAGDTIYDSGEYVADSAGMKIKVRGNGTARHRPEAPPYRIKLSRKFDLFQRPDSTFKTKSYVLLNSFASNRAVYHAANIVGEMVRQDWQPDIRYCNVVMNGRYLGLYCLSDPVKEGSHHVDITQSGFIVEFDAYWWIDPEAVSFESLLFGGGQRFTFKYPEEGYVQKARLEEISSYIHGFEQALADEGDIAEWIDVESYARWLLCHDILGTVDPAGSNLFMYKTTFDPANPTSTKMKMGPIWDFDACMAQNVIGDDWAWIHREWARLFYYERLLKRSDFQACFIENWERVKDHLYSKVTDSIGIVLKREHEAIDVSRQLSGRGYTSIARLNDVKDWMSHRIAWIDDNIMTVSGIDRVGVGLTDAVRLDVFDLHGRPLWQTRPDADLNHAPLPQGCYLFRFIGPDSTVIKSGKFVKK